MKRNNTHITKAYNNHKSWLFTAFFGLWSWFALGQVSAEIDTTAIKIGEQIMYTISVKADTIDLVNFPEDQTFSPLEMVEALAIDTVTENNQMVLKRKYALTQFDSGAYTIPPQRIAINDQAFLTDSFNIKVADVVVDTTKQKMYDIKPLIKVEKAAENSVDNPLHPSWTITYRWFSVLVLFTQKNL